MSQPPVQLEASLLPYAAVGVRRSQLGFGIRAHGAPRALGTGLHDGAGGEANGADVGGLPQLSHEAVYPALEPRSGEGRVPLGLLHVSQADGDVEHRVQAMEALLHVAVLCWPVVEPQRVL